jgi:hypothetical protein
MVDWKKTFMFFQDCPFILQLIQEILDFKSWVNGYLNDGLDVLVNHMDLHLFRFSMDKVKWLVMQYKVFPTDAF